MSPAELWRLIRDCESAEEIESTGVQVWKVGDKMKVDGKAVVLTELVVVQDPESPRQGRVVFLGHTEGNPQELVNGSFAILFPGACQKA